MTSSTASDRLSRRHSEAEICLLISLVCGLPSVLDLSRTLAAIGLGALVAFPLVVIWTVRRRLMVSDPISIIGIMWVLAVTMPVLLPDLYEDASWYRIAPWALDTGALWMYRAWAGCCVAYWLIRALLWGREQGGAATDTSIDASLEQNVRVAIGVLSLIATMIFLVTRSGNAYTFVASDENSSTFAQVLHELRQLSSAYIFLHVHARGKSRLKSFEGHLLMALFVSQAFVFLATGTKSVPVEIGAAWLLGSVAAKAHSRLGREALILVVSLGALYTVFYINTAYRNEMKTRALSANASWSESVSQQFDALWVAVGHFVDGKELGTDENKYGAGSMLDRLAHLGSFANLLQYSNGESPHEHAVESLLAPIVALLPRDLLGDAKVQFLNSGRFAQMMGWDFGGLSISLPGSIFWAWGYDGIVPGMMLLGGIVAVTCSFAQSSSLAGFIHKNLYCKIVLLMLDVGGEFQPIFISLTRNWIFLMVLLLLVQALTRTRETSYR